MARRRIGQEDLIARPEPRAALPLLELAALLDWAEIDRHLVGISAAAKGEHGWPPLALFRGLLLATWYDLSEVKLASYDTTRHAPALGGNGIGASMKEFSRHVQRIRGRDCISPTGGLLCPFSPITQRLRMRTVRSE